MPIGVVLAGETLLPTTVNDQEGYLAELEKTVPIGPVHEYGDDQIIKACVHVIYRRRTAFNIRSWTRCVIGATGIIGTPSESFDGATSIADTEIQEV